MWYHLKGIFIDITENHDSSLKVVTKEWWPPFSKMAAIWPRSNFKLISFSIERTQIHDSDVYFRVFRHARHSSVTRKHPGHCIVGQIQDGRHLFKIKPLIYIIFDEIEADS